MNAFDPYNPSHWAGAFAQALGVIPIPPGGGPAGSVPPSGGGDQFPTGPGTGTQNPAPSLPDLTGLFAGGFTRGADSLVAPQPQQGQELAQPDQYGGDEYAHAGWGTAQPFDYSNPQRHSPQYPQGPSPWESYWTWLGKYANPQSGYHVGGRY